MRNKNTTKDSIINSKIIPLNLWDLWSVIRCFLSTSYFDCLRHVVVVAIDEKKLICILFNNQNILQKINNPSQSIGLMLYLGWIVTSFLSIQRTVGVLYWCCWVINTVHCSKEDLNDHKHLKSVWRFTEKTKCDFTGTIVDWFLENSI